MSTPENARGEGERKRGCGYWLRLLGVAVVGFVVIGWTGYNVAWVLSMSDPAPSTPCCLTPADVGYAYEDVAFAGADGDTLRGWYVPGDNGAVIILLHGLGSNRASMLARGELLAKHGYGLLLYDRRATGESDGRWRTFGWADARDVPAAVDFALAQAGVEQVGIHGFSLGGQVALAGAAADERIGAVVAEEPGFVRASDIPPLSDVAEKYTAFLYWLDLRGLSVRTGEPMPDGLLERLPALAPRPVFYLSSGPAAEVGHRLVAHFDENTPGPSELWHVPEAGHGAISRLRTEEYEGRTVDFFARAFGFY